MVKTLFKFYIIFTGFLMGIADTLPGISGSTITYVLGLYEQFIYSISNLTSKKEFKKSFLFLIKLGAGWIIGAIFSVLLLSHFAKDNIYFISSLFLGLVIATMYITYKNIKQLEDFTTSNMITFFIGTFGTIIIFFLGWNIINYFTGFLIYIYIFIVGIIAICCMLLPGVSGSSIFLVFGIYYPLIDTLSSILKGDVKNLGYLFVLVLGILFGLFAGARAISNLFDNHKKNALSLILGILLGSIIPIIYGPLTIPGYMYNMLGFSNMNYIGLIIGILILLGLNRLRYLKERTL